MVKKWRLVAVSGQRCFTVPCSDTCFCNALKAGEVMLIGEFSHSIDEKGRVRIPKNFRDDLGETFYITKGFEKCLFVFPESEWKNFMEKLRSNNFKDSKNRKIQRFFTGSAIEASLDGQGRTTISQALRAFADLDKEVAVIGMDNRVEIWSAENWDSYNDDDEDISTLADGNEGFII